MHKIKSQYIKRREEVRGMQTSFFWKAVAIKLIISYYQLLTIKYLNCPHELCITSASAAPTTEHVYKRANRRAKQQQQVT